MQQQGEGTHQSTGKQASSSNSASQAVPVIQLPKGGGAIKGIGEKFAANAVNGTGSMSVPIATSPGRGGIGPQLSLAYDSGAGNGPFGFGWSLSLPSIARKTDKGLPRYVDEADTFVLSDAEDLVPVYRQDFDGTWVASNRGFSRDHDAWVRDPDGNMIVHEDRLEGYRVRRYRPRVEGLFARIELWMKIGNARDVHWRSISKDNVLSVYGCDENSRVADPLDASRIFAWLICETRDDKGNAVLYRYKPEDGVGLALGKVHERNRGAADDLRRTANRYLKRIHYGNLSPLLDAHGKRPRALDYAEIDAQIAAGRWMFEVVFDYGDHHPVTPAPSDYRSLDGGAPRYPWTVRPDSFSTYRSAFEVRTTRLCKRVLMFHHFPGTEHDGVGADCLVRSTDLTYSHDVDPTRAANPVYAFLSKVTQKGYRRNGNAYDSRSMPPVEFEYSQPEVSDKVEHVDAASLENLPIGLDGATYRWSDLHGEGVSGVLTEQAGTWYYKRNLSPLPIKLPDGHELVRARLAPLEPVRLRPNAMLGRGAELMDLAGDGQPDIVTLSGPIAGFYEHDAEEGWGPFQPFDSPLNRDFGDPNLRMLDLDGDGHADVLISEDDAWVWHVALAEKGFGPAQRVVRALDEEHGPRVVFADGTMSIYLADLSGDGLTDIVRIRNGEVCYWPNLGHGRFGAKITMDNSPWFDNPDQFDQQCIRLADIDGSGTTDIIYLHRDGVRVYFNQSGNGWSQPQLLHVFPRYDDLTSIASIDLLGNGTACLVWSSPLPHDSGQPMRYVNLMRNGKPHLLVKTLNNLGAETTVDYAPSTKFYLQDERDGIPWISRLPFPVHVVERVSTYDHVNRNRFVTRYAYHHGYFDGIEREFRGFGMVEQWDSELFSALTSAGGLPQGYNEGPESHVPPVHTKTWFHTGVYVGGGYVSDYFAGLLTATDRGEYYREAGLTDEEARALLLTDTVLPSGLSVDEQREASRALKGSMLRQEVYSDDAAATASAAARERARTPYAVAEQSFAVRVLQRRHANRHAIFFTHASEAITYQYERSPADPRVQHALTLDVDRHGNVLKQVVVGYGRRSAIRVVDQDGRVQQVANPGLRAISTEDRAKQTTPLLTYSENRFTNMVESADTHRTPQLCEALTFELTRYAPTGPAGRFQRTDFVQVDESAGALNPQPCDEVTYESAATANPCRRPVEKIRTLFRSDDLSRLLELGKLESRGLPGESYKLAFTPGLLAQAFQRLQAGQPSEPLIPVPPALLGGQAGDRGGYLRSQTARADGRFPADDGDDHWWLPSGQQFFAPDVAASPATELDHALRHFFMPRRYRDPFNQNVFVDFDANDFLPIETRDPVGNRVTVNANDYRVLQPRLVSDPNRNRTEVCFDLLGMVVGTALMGKPAPAKVEGDTLEAFVSDPPKLQLDEFLAAPRRAGVDPARSEAAPVAHELLQGATTRVVYDLERFMTSREPVVAATIARETHAADLAPGAKSNLRIAFSYSDGFGREIQKKVQAEPGPLVEDGPVVSPRWIGSGWTVFNNKGKPVRQYEPFFSRRQRENGEVYSDHKFEFGAAVGVSPILFYDPAERVVATLHPNHSYEKIVFDPWKHTSYDVNDTCAARNEETGDPRTDRHIAGYVRGYFESLAEQPARTWQTWYAQRIGGALGAVQRIAAQRAAAHADTPAAVHFDVLGRPYLTVARNRVVCAAHDLDGDESEVATRVDFDIEGNERAVRDERKRPIDYLPSGALEQRVVVRYGYDMLGNRICELSMEAGARWMLYDAAGKPLRAWDNRGHNFATVYDSLRRPVEQTVAGTTSLSDPLTRNRNVMCEKIEYGESVDGAEDLNLRSRVYRHADSAGVVANARFDDDDDPVEAYDFKGNLLCSTRRLVSDYTALPDWWLNPTLDAERFEGRVRFDALNRPIQSVAPHSDRAATRNVLQPAFTESNLLHGVDVWLEHGGDPDGLLDRAAVAPSAVGVRKIEYNAKGQRLRIEYGNGASTSYQYDPLTSRLARILTRRTPATFPDDDPQPPVPGWPGRQLQNLHYTHDAVGNITHVQDDAQQTIFFKNKRVEPSKDYVYDAFYRLIQASGREHLGQGGAPSAHSHGDEGRVGLAQAANGNFSPSDGTAMGTYVERYVYDAVGNFLQMQHRGTDPAHAGWTRAYHYGETSLTEDGTGGTPLRMSNRLTRTTLNPHDPAASTVEPYEHDAHGNMTRMPHLGTALSGPNIHWDYRNRLRSVDLGGGGAAYYVYDASGERVRKVWEKSPGRTEERIYLGGFEIFRKHAGAIGDGTATLERETLHVMDVEQRIALVETRTLDVAGADPAPRELVRYRLCDHLGSATLGLDDRGLIVSYEEYAPYGSSTYQAVRSQTESSSRYRYTGKERDEESGLYCHGARYFASWLGRWASPDPAGVAEGLDSFVYVSDNPIVFYDPNGKEIEAYNIAPGRPGNQPWAWFLGIAAHRLIAYHYAGQHMHERRGIFANFYTIAAILTNTGLGDPARISEKERQLKPDITNAASREVFEIKPWNDEGLKAGRAQVNQYKDALNKGMTAKYPFLTGRGESGELAVQFQGGRMVWRLIWKTTEDGVIQYKWQKTNKSDRDDIQRAGEGQWVDITEQDAAAYGVEVGREAEEALKRREKLFKLMDDVNLAQSLVGAAAAAALMSAMLNSQPRPSTGVPAGPNAPPPSPPSVPPGQPVVPNPPPAAPQPWMIPPKAPPVHAPHP